MRRSRKNITTGMPLFESEEQQRRRLIINELVRFGIQRREAGLPAYVSADDVHYCSTRLLKKTAVGKLFCDPHFRCTGLTKKADTKLNPKGKGHRILIWEVIDFSLSSNQF